MACRKSLYKVSTGNTSH